MYSTCPRVDMASFKLCFHAYLLTVYHVTLRNTLNSVLVLCCEASLLYVLALIAFSSLLPVPNCAQECRDW